MEKFRGLTELDIKKDIGDRDGWRIRWDTEETCGLWQVGQIRDGLQYG